MKIIHEDGDGILTVVMSAHEWQDSTRIPRDQRIAVGDVREVPNVSTVERRLLQAYEALREFFPNGTGASK